MRRECQGCPGWLADCRRMAVASIVPSGRSTKSFLVTGGLFTWRLAPRRGVLDLGVHLRPDHNDETGQKEPKQQENHPPNSAVGGLVVAEVHGIDPEQE